MKDSPSYWTIRIGEAESTEAFTLDDAEAKYARLSEKHPDKEIQLCGVWIIPIATRAAKGGGDVG